MRRRTRRAIVATTAVVVLVGGGAWWLFGRGGGGAANATTRTVTASLTTLQQTVQATGTLTPTVQRDVSFTVSGTVTSVAVAPGDTVVAGQTLATVDTLQLNADLLTAKADLATAQAAVANLAGASSTQVAAAAARRDVAAAAVSTAEANLTAATLVAPVGGLVTTVGVATGDKVTGSGQSSTSQSASTGQSGSGQSPGGSQSGGAGSAGSGSSSSQFTIVGTDAYQTTLTVGAADLPNVTVGEQVEMTSTELADTVFGVVASVGLVPSTSASSSGTTGYPVVVTVTGDASALHDGLSVTAQIVYERRTDVLTVPAMAVTTTGGTSTVLKVGADGKTTKTEVTTGQTSGMLTEIVSGLSEGDQVQITVVPRTRPSQSGQTGGGYGGLNGGGYGGQRPDFGNGRQMPVLPQGNGQ